MISIDYYSIKGDNLEVGDAFIWDGFLWIKLGDTDDEGLFPAFCLDPEVGKQEIAKFDGHGDPLTRVDMDITVTTAVPRRT